MAWMMSEAMGVASSGRAFLICMVSVMLVCYVMYTVSPEVIERFQSPNLYMTSFFVIIGLLRYIQLTVIDRKSGDPTLLVLKDRFIQLVVIGWLATFAIIIYL